MKFLWMFFSSSTVMKNIVMFVFQKHFMILKQSSREIFFGFLVVVSVCSVEALLLRVYVKVFSHFVCHSTEWYVDWYFFLSSQSYIFNSCSKIKSVGKHVYAEVMKVRNLLTCGYLFASCVTNSGSRSSSGLTLSVCLSQ